MCVGNLRIKFKQNILKLIHSIVLFNIILWIISNSVFKSTLSSLLDSNPSYCKSVLMRQQIYNPRPFLRIYGLFPK
mgnify:CR=1 FL=1